MKKTKKKQVKQIVTWILLAALVAGLTAMPLIAAEEEEDNGLREVVLSAQVQVMDMDVGIRAGGTLASGDAQQITLPSGVKITEFLVENGQTVTEGTPLARVDRVSVMEAILKIHDSMETLRGQMEDATDDTIGSRISSAAGGRVKVIYAAKGDSVQEVMLEHGALAILSLDGLMAVTLEGVTGLGTGDPVSVIRETGEILSGRVESSLAGTLVITVEDEGYAAGEPVRVTAEDGREIGTGSLEIHNPWKATGFSGTVQTVHIRQEQTVSKGASLFTLTDRSFTGNRDALAGTYEKYAELLQKLFVMYEEEVITAPGDGIVSGVDAESTFLLSADQTPWTPELLHAPAQSSWQFLFLSNTEEVECTGEETEEDACKAREHKKGCYYYCTGTASCTAKPTDHFVTCISLCISAEEEGKCLALNHKSDCIGKCESAQGTGTCPAEHHKVSCVESCIPTDGSTDCPASVHKPECLEACDKKAECPATVHHDPHCISLCTGEEDCPALNHREDCYMTKLTYTAWAALVRQVGTTELIVAADPQTQYQLKTGSNGWELVEPAEIRQDLMILQQTVPAEDPSLYKPGDILLFWTGSLDGQEVCTGIAVHSSGNSLEGNVPGMNIPGLGGMFGFGGMGGFGGGSGAPAATEELYDLTEQVLLTVTDHSVMTLTVTVDEKDISRVYPGQEAQVKITALRGETFRAQVTKVGASGTNNGGSSKFTVELTLPWREDMLAGMHAAAVIAEYTAEQIPVIPVAALYERPDATVVYTGLNPETGMPADPVEVTVGISDGDYVQILAGLDTDSRVYYTYYEAPELDHTVD